MRFVLDGRAMDDASGDALPATAAVVAARILRSDNARTALLAAIRAAHPADGTPFETETAPLVLLERLENFLSTGAFQPDDGQAVVRAHAFCVLCCVLRCVAPNARTSVILRS